MILFILGGVFILGLVVVVHEFGHYLMGRLVGIKAEIVSVGYGRGVWKKKIGETTWQIGAIPLGGYVKFYGDDFTNPVPVPGGFFDAHPLKRVVTAAGGPFFNLILGFLIFILIHSISGPVSSKVYVQEELGKQSPAYQGGLRNNDIVTAINGEPVKSFVDIRKHVALSSGAVQKFTVARPLEGGGTETVELDVKPNVGPAGTAYIGLRFPGPRNLEVNYPLGAYWKYQFSRLFGDSQPPQTLAALPYLDDGDVILKVNDIPVNSINGLQKILGANHGQVVAVTVKRQTVAWLTPSITHVETVQVPTRGEYKLTISAIRDLKYDAPVSQMAFASMLPIFQKALEGMEVDGKPAGSYEELFQNYADTTAVSLIMGGQKYDASLKTEKIGVFGFRALSRIESEYTKAPESVGAVISAAAKDTWGNIAIYGLFFKKLFSGRISFIDNAMGPVGMFAIAGQVMKSGFHDYLQWLAFISIALMVTNLMPFPVVDGGHIVMYLYEAISGKPLSPAVMEGLYRFGFSVLLFLGLWVMYRDIGFVFR